MRYLANRPPAAERTNPPIYHSRYVHLKLLLNETKYLVDKYIRNRENLDFADLGCGELPYYELVTPHVRNYWSIDLPGNGKATHTIDPITNRSALDDKSCDVVWSLGVLEHVEDVDKYLQESFRILKPGGRLILATHGIWMYHPDPIDYWRFTSEGLKVTIERKGFKVVEKIGVMGLLSTSIQLLQDAVLISFPFVKYWKIPFCFIMQRLISISEYFINSSKVLRAHRNKDACFYFMIAEKKDEL